MNATEFTRCPRCDGVRKFEVLNPRTPERSYWRGEDCGHLVGPASREAHHLLKNAFPLVSAEVRGMFESVISRGGALRKGAAADRARLAKSDGLAERIRAQVALAERLTSQPTTH